MLQNKIGIILVRGGTDFELPSHYSHISRKEINYQFLKETKQASNHTQTTSWINN